MSEINRGLLIVKPKQPLFDWIQTLPDQTEVLEGDQVEHDDMAAIEFDNTAYLVPEFEDDEEAKEVLHELYSYIFEKELESWALEESDWPKNRDLTMFVEWFEVEFHSIVHDLAVGLPMTDDDGYFDESDDSDDPD